MSDKLQEEGLDEKATAPSDDDDEYFDANDEVEESKTSSLEVPAENGHVLSPSISVVTMEGDPAEIEEDKDFKEKDDVSSVISSNKSMVLRIISQIRIGSDLTRFVMPIFIFEKRSLLELYAEFFAHPDIITKCADLQDPRDRILEVTKWFLLSFSASRKAGIPKKPYNPILGETFSCYWDVPQGKRTAPNIREKSILESGPVEYAGYDSMSFIAEQVSHHPPVSALYVECPSKRFYFQGTVESKIKFGLSVKIHNHGKFELHFLNYDEVYEGSLPHGYVRSFLTTPWLEFGGDCTISCPKSGYNANIEFHTKPFRGGQKHRITGNIKHVSESKPFIKLEGNWNNQVFKKISKDQSEVFMDVKSIPTVRKKLKKFHLQDENESRSVWRYVTEALEREDAEAASVAKHEVEERQRQKARDLRNSGDEWQPKHFTLNPNHKEGPVWLYKSNLQHRICDNTHS